MKLSHLTNKILLTDIKKLVETERKSTLEILFHLKEIDQRKLFSDLKYPSLFAYCVQELGYSESAAQRRIVAARLLRSIPEIGSKIASGHLSLSNISQVVRASKSKEDQKILLEHVEGLSKKACEKKIFEITGKEIPEKDSIKRVTSDKVKIAIIVNDETLKQIDHLKSLLGLENMDDVLAFATRCAIEKIEKEKFKQTKPRKSPPPAEVSRTPSNSVKRAVYQRDKKCSNCGGSRHLQFDHCLPYALGGKSTEGNIRLLCFHCNQRARMRAGLSIDLSLKEQAYTHPPP